jgi:hypothetical protein
MIIHNLNKFPAELNYRYGALDELSSYDMGYLNRYYDADEVWYWYSSGSYEGSGQMLIRKGDLYDIHDMGHCSCYGPLDRMSLSFKPLEELKSSCSSEYLKEVESLFIAAID